MGQVMSPTILRPRSKDQCIQRAWKIDKTRTLWRIPILLSFLLSQAGVWTLDCELIPQGSACRVRRSDDIGGWRSTSSRAPFLLTNTNFAKSITRTVFLSRSFAFFLSSQSLFWITRVFRLRDLLHSPWEYGRRSLQFSLFPLPFGGLSQKESMLSYLIVQSFSILQIPTLLWISVIWNEQFTVRYLCQMRKRLYCWSTELEWRE